MFGIKINLIFSKIKFLFQRCSQVNIYLTISRSTTYKSKQQSERVKNA